MRGSGNDNYELDLKRIAVIVACAVLSFLFAYSRESFKYILHKKDYVLVQGTVEDTVVRTRLGHHGHLKHKYYTIIKVTEPDGSVYEVQAIRRAKDKIGKTVVIAINPLDDKKNTIKGVWTSGFWPYGNIKMFLYCFGILIVIIPGVISGKRGEWKRFFKKILKYM
ncbi:MAG: hypothetical protein HDT41_04995 [Lachnospiraceae bacterium]|nr:hypothetical protein [Lachnospiraceae bacterium]